MNKSSFRTFFSYAAVAGALALLAGGAIAQDSGPATQTQGTNTRTLVGPAIGFIDSPNGYCYQPDQYQDACYINWNPITVDAAPNYMIYLTVQLDGRMVAKVNGFFQTSITIPGTMNGQGFKVKCGALGASGDPEFGKAYPYTIRAKDSNGLTSANYGTATCPAYLGSGGRGG